MQTVILIIFGIVALGLLSALIVVLSRKPATDNLQNQVLEKLSSELKEIRSEMKGSLEKNLEFVTHHSGRSSDLVKDITVRLEQVLNTNKQVVDFASQLQSLENILSNPKHRGILGEYFLENMLTSVLPPDLFEMQYKMANGEIVDAAIFLSKEKNLILPVDAKFSLEKYRLLAENKSPETREVLEKEFKKDLKMRIDETAKYVRPEENTTPYAIMYMPAEGVLGMLGDTNLEDLMKYALSKKVTIASPFSLFTQLQNVMHYVKFLKFQDSTKEIQKRVEDLGRHLVAYTDYMGKLGNNLSTTVNAYNTAYKELGKIDKDVVKLTGKEREIEPLQIDRPVVE